LGISGALDAGAMAAAVGDVVGRHESLRTVFPAVDGVPEQRILDPAEARARVCAGAGAGATCAGAGADPGSDAVPEADAAPGDDGDPGVDAVPDPDGVPGADAAPGDDGCPGVDADAAWHVVDASAWPEQRLDEAVRAVARRGFDLAADLPFRARLFAVSATEHRLVLVVHHIAGDGWSLAPLLRDLWSAYEARRAGAAPSWAPLPVQYADYALWQHRALGDEGDEDSVLARQMRYWERRLDGLPGRLELPTDRPYPQVAGHRGGRVAVAWPVEFQEAVQRTARERD
ncbi:condensation domain-containing protein, partial [Streptomyces cacaoi]